MRETICNAERYRLALRVIAFACAAAMTVPAVAQDGQRLLGIEMLSSEQAAAAAGLPPRQALVVDAWVDDPDMTYFVGEDVGLSVVANQDAHLLVLGISADGSTTILYPNESQPTQPVRAGEVLAIPGPDAAIRVSGEPGVELIKIIASSEPIPSTLLGELVEAGVFRSVDTGGLPISRRLELVLASVREAQWDVENVVIRTAANPVADPTDAAFGLEIGSDRAAYRIGEAIGLFIRADRACALTLINIGSSGRARLLLPNPAVGSMMMPSGQTIAIPGLASDYAIQPMGPEGTETVVAFCAVDGVTLPYDLGAIGQGLLHIGDGADLGRDLLVLSQQAPIDGVAIAYATFTVLQ